MQKTKEEIEALKENWMKDPCWDIETTESFEEYTEELLIWRKQIESEWEAARIEREEAHADLVREQTGVVEIDIVSALYTFGEIEGKVASLDRYIPNLENFTDTVIAELEQTQIRTNLLIAAQLKRIADALEMANAGNDLVRVLNMGAIKE